MKIKGIKIDEDVAKILNEQDKDDTSKYRVYYTNESINEDYEEDDYEDVTEEMHKERYVTYFETQEGRQRYTIYHVYTDSTDDSYNELCDKRDNQLGMYNSYKELRDALKERAEKIAEQQGWTVKSIENLGEDDEYYRERNKRESIKDGFNIGDKVWRRNPETQDRMIGEVIDKSHKDGQEYITVKFYWWSSHDGTYPADFFQKLDKNESINEAGKCTWHAWQEGKKYACIDDCTYGHIDDFIGMEEDIERFVKAGWVNANGEIVIPAGAEFQVRKLHTPNGIVLYFPDVDMELDTGLDEDDNTLYEIINESKNEGFISPAEERQIFQCFIRCGQDIDKTIETLRLAATHFEEADIRKVCAYAYVDLASEDWFTKHPDWEEDMPLEAYNKILKDAEEILGEKLRDDYYVESANTID